MYSIETVVRTIKGEKKENKMVFGTGRLTAEPPTVADVKGGYKVLRASKDARFAIAFNNGKDKSATFYNLVLWDKNAENMAKLGFKGQLVQVAGRLEEQPYTAQDGTKKTSEVLVVERFEVLQYKDNGASTTNGNATAETKEEEIPTGLPGAEVDGTVGDDDIPF